MDSQSAKNNGYDALKLWCSTPPISTLYIPSPAARTTSFAYLFSPSLDVAVLVRSSATWLLTVFMTRYRIAHDIAAFAFTSRHLAYSRPYSWLRITSCAAL